MFELAAPCENCPFLRDSGERLLPARVREIAGNMLRLDGGAFLCHKTVDYTDDYGAITVDSQHCAGALLFALKNGSETQIMRLARRPGLGPGDPARARAGVRERRRDAAGSQRPPGRAVVDDADYRERPRAT
ncbi:MAG: hypothetical protein ACRDJN_00625 [Chloroflexota bacterium]